VQRKTKGCLLYVAVVDTSVLVHATQKLMTANVH